MEKEEKVTPVLVKGKDFIDESKFEKGPEPCELCEVHNQAYEYFNKTDGKESNKFICPYCGAVMGFDEFYPDFGKIVIGEDNSCNVEELKEQVFRHVPSMECDHCHKTIALIPTAISHNCNHDVYYTGGKSYLVEKAKIDMTEVNKRIKQFRDRIANGEDPKSMWVESWIESAIEQTIAKELYKRGLKI